ncbi:hypothetical protein WJX74_006324 [Apatococcus lobatus]|uniref:Uncharacterized protein n=1 Tax=Apatococcus lobatus TaxID=904363 RepID=A0AAW1QNE7_9CHLO
MELSSAKHSLKASNVVPAEEGLKKQRRTLGSYNKAKKAHNKRQQVHLKQMRTIQQLRELYYAPDQARCMDLLPSEDGPDDEEGPIEEGEAGQQEEDGNSS